MLMVSEECGVLWLPVVQVEIWTLVCFICRTFWARVMIIWWLKHVYYRILGDSFQQQNLPTQNIPSIFVRCKK